jgi:hypothetical protein
MRNEGESHRRGRTVASDDADEALGPSSELARVLHAQADELAANGFSPLAAWRDPGVKAIDYLLRSTVRWDHGIIFAAESPGVDPGARWERDVGTEPGLSAWEPHPPSR